jgi:hypothetical protein
MSPMATDPPLFKDWDYPLYMVKSKILSFSNPTANFATTALKIHQNKLVSGHIYADFEDVLIALRNSIKGSIFMMLDKGSEDRT